MHQNRLAQMLGVDETLLSRMLNGYRQPNAELRSRIAALLESDEAWLFEAEETPARKAGAGTEAP